MHKIKMIVNGMEELTAFIQSIPVGKLVNVAPLGDQQAFMVVYISDTQEYSVTPESNMTTPNTYR